MFHNVMFSIRFFCFSHGIYYSWVLFSIISNIHQKIGRLVDPLFKNCYTQGKDILGTVKFAKIETLVIRLRSFSKLLSRKKMSFLFENYLVEEKKIVNEKKSIQNAI